MKKSRTDITKSNNYNVNDKRIRDLNAQRIKKNVFKETDPDHHEEVEDFLKRYKDDTLTGL